ncbi:MAG: hypothetical protein KBH75_11395 [Saprospiraceae bacterium]|nr:hypothetical protein [Saprospiraceae bacterium]
MNTLTGPTLALLVIAHSLLADALFAQALDLSPQVYPEFADDDEMNRMEQSGREVQWETIPENKSDINKMGYPDLAGIPGISEDQAMLIARYVDHHRPLHSLLELQVLEGVTRATLVQLSEYAYVPEDLFMGGHLQHSRPEKRGQLLVRFGRALNLHEAYTLSDSSLSAYQGSPDVFLMKGQFHLSPTWQIGLALEKDAGEFWFNRKRPLMLDRISAHAQWMRPMRRLEKLCLGDYQVSLGQGLLIDNASFGISTLGSGISFKLQNTLIARSSPAESRGLRGLAAELRLTKQLRLFVFGSLTSIDARIDTLFDPDGNKTKYLVGKWYETGLHRTQTELIHRETIRRFIAGAALIRSLRGGEVGFQVQSRREPYERSADTNAALRFVPISNKLLYASAFYQYPIRNFRIAGELSLDDHGHTATQHTLLAGLGKKAEFAASLYAYGRGFYAPLSDANGAEGKSWNAIGRGLHFKLRLKHGALLKLNYAFQRPQWQPVSEVSDRWVHRMGLELSAEKRRNWRYAIRLGIRLSSLESSFHNAPDSPTVSEVNAPVDLRMFFEKRVTGSLIWRSHLGSKVTFRKGTQTPSYLIAQDILFRPTGGRISLNVRAAWHDGSGTDSYFYVHEQDVSQHFSYVRYSGNGLRLYANARLKLGSGITAEVKYARSLKLQSSIAGPLQSGAVEHQDDVRVQFRMEIR